MNYSTYQSSIDWLFHQFPAFQKKGALAYHPTLDNVLALIDFFEINYKGKKFIHVAGTNGKGSTCSNIASILKEYGYKVGLFTSPHLKDFRERIRINGKMIDEEEVFQFIDIVKRNDLPVKPSFFELSWVMALKYFVDENCDYIVVETGLGGRLDATNIIQPILSIITNIGLDHQSILGETKEEIAVEKAGIIKTNVPVLIGESNQVLSKIFKAKAQDKNALFFQLKEFLDSFVENNKQLARAAIYLLSELNEFKYDEPIVLKGLRNVSLNTGLAGRFQKIATKPNIIVDGAHNVDGVKSLLEHYKNNAVGDLHIIYGASQDKNVADIVQLFPDDAKCYFTSFNHERAMNIDELKIKTVSFQGEKSYYKNEQQAMHEAKQFANQKDTVLVFGSFFLIEKFI
jgi:dihydrofolate synthase/folylpolyglutamate synthase